MRSLLNQLLVVMTLAAGCADVADPGAAGPAGPADPANAGALRVWVTDAPFPYGFVESASVVIREVQVRNRDTGGWEVVFSGESEFDLVPLTNGAEMLLVEASPGPGTYDEVRLIVQGGEVVLGPEAVVQDGDPVFSSGNGRLHFPSGAQTGIKVKIENDIVVTTELSADLVLDFDLARNFVFNGPVTHPPGVKRVIFTPTVRAVNASTAGTIGVTVLSDNVTPADASDDTPIDGATVRVLEAGSVVATASTGADGRALVGVPPGTYDVAIEASGHGSAALTGAVVVLANLTDLGSVVLAAAGEIGGVVMSDGGTTDDDADDVVVEGATVELRVAGETGTALATTTTDASGGWRFEDLAAGIYDIAVSAAGFGPGSLSGIAAEATTPGYAILLEALPQDVTGTVTVPAGVDVTTIAIEVKNAAGVTVATTAPASDGTYGVTLATGDYEIVFDDGVSPQTVAVELVGADPAPSPKVVDVTFE
jgi:hypothetical protein